MSSAIARRRRPRRTILLLGALGIGAALAVGIGVTGGEWIGNGHDADGAERDELYVNPTSNASASLARGEGGAAIRTLASTPTAIWLTPESYPLVSVESTVRAIADDAARTGATAVFTVYGITGRDCGSESAGGLPEDAYREWVDDIAAALSDRRSIVILEPDSIALAGDCGSLDARLTQIRDAATVLADAGQLVYLDGGHSAWLDPEIMAGWLTQAGIGLVQGFATNVSNYQSTTSELAYAHELSALLDGKNFVIDTGRNGSGGNLGEWCNPDGQVIGALPMSLEATDLDANLWVKPPGESDGTCGSGPPAGVWWPERAVDLADGTPESGRG